MHNIWGFLLQTLTVTLVAFLLLFIKRLFEDKLSPRWQYGIWGIFAFRILLPVSNSRNILLPLPLALETLKAIVENRLNNSMYTDIYTPLELRHPFPFQTILPASFTDWLFVCYTGGVIFFLLRYLIAYWKLRILLKSGEPISTSMQQRINNACELYQLTSCPAITITGLRSAFVCGVIKPILVLPSDKEVDDKILLHELLHLKHRDALQNLLWCLLRCLHWCNPLLLPVFRRIENDMESLCDQRVLEHLSGEERREYGRILLAMANDTYARAPGTTSISNGGKQISKRIAAIVRFKKYPKGMALVSLCLVLLLGIPSLIGTAATYPNHYFQPATLNELTRSMALARTYRCSTMAGALDTYAKGLLFHNGIYIAMASPLSCHAELETLLQSNSNSSDGMLWFLSPDQEMNVRPEEGYQIYNLKEIRENRYEALLVLPIYKTYAIEKYFAGKDGSIADENSHPLSTCCLFIPLQLWKEDAWVVEECGERTISTKLYSDISFDNDSSDIPWLQEHTITGKTGILAVSAKLSYHIDNTITQNNELSFLFGPSTFFQEIPKPDAEFKEIRLETVTEYTCHNTGTEKLPKKSLRLQSALLDAEAQRKELDWSPMEPQGTFGLNYAGSSSNGYSWVSRTVTASDKSSYHLKDIGTDVLYDVHRLPAELPYGLAVRIFWDSEFAEEFIVRWNEEAKEE